MKKIKTLIKCVFRYKEKYYSVEDILPNCLQKETAIFLYKEGNYSDDIYRAALIRIRYGEDEVPDLLEGSKEIELVNIDVECS